MFSSSKNTSRFLEIVCSLFTMLILVEWYQMWVKLSDTFVLSLFYHRSGIIFRGTSSKTTWRLLSTTSMRSHITIADDMVSHHVITLFFCTARYEEHTKKQYLRWDGITAKTTSHNTTTTTQQRKNANDETTTQTKQQYKQCSHNETTKQQ